MCEIDAQKNGLSFGLSHKQSQNELPKSKAEIVFPEKKLKFASQTKLIPAEDSEYIISEGWELIEAHRLIASGNSVFDKDLDTSEWYNATVPGTVLTTLIDRGVYSDPYFGINNLFIPDTLCRMDWWYRTSFQIPNGLKGKKVQLVLNGINYKAEIWLNKKLIGNIFGAFKRGFFDITDYLDEDLNILAIRIFPPNNPGIPHEENKNSYGPNGGVLCLDGPTFISSEGWDWVPGIRDRNIGLWQDVRLRTDEGIRIVDPQIITDLLLPDTTMAKITIKTKIHNATNDGKGLVLQARIEDKVIRKEVFIEKDNSKDIVFSVLEFPELLFRNPRLWWPNGYGAQNLYDLRLTVYDNYKIVDERTIRFGIREMSYELLVDDKDQKNLRVEYSPTNVIQKDKMLFDYSKRRLFSPDYKHTVVPALLDSVGLHNFEKISADSDNPHLLIKVNGYPIFLRGGNWGMDDGMKRVSRERLEPFFRFHKDANLNMIRNWTGESTEKDFFDLCDEYGMLVWNDFWMSTGGKDLEPADDQLFIDNATDVVRRFRNHPSIAVWCPRNEGYAPDFLEEKLYSMVLKEDGTRHYHGNSRIMNSRRSGPWGFIDPMKYYDELAFGFNTELGTLSVPTAETIRKFIAKEDLWPIGDVWYYHNLAYSDFGWKEYIEAVDKIGKFPCKNVDEFCDRSQMLNYNSHRDLFESWNSRMWNNTSGVLLWMSHPAWYSMMWQIYTYDGETHGSFYGTKKACEPVHVQWNLNDKRAVLINTTLKSYKDTKLYVKGYDISGNLIWDKSSTQSVLPNSKQDCFIVNIPMGKDVLSLVRLILTDSKGNVISENDYWTNREFQTDLSAFALLPEASVQFVKGKIEIIKNESRITFVIQNTSNYIASFLKINLKDKNGTSILPVITNHGYFNLLPRQKKEVEIMIPDNKNIEGCYLSLVGFNVKEKRKYVKAKF